MIRYVEIRGEPWARDSSRGSFEAQWERRKEDARAELEMRDHFERLISEPKKPEEFWVEALRA